jgi:HTH-type transcriptional regulator/antitoxin HigA
MNQIKVIKNERQHALALKAIEQLWDARPGSRQAEELDIWSTLVEVYEQNKHAILPPEPVAAIKFRMEQDGLQASDLTSILGGSNRVSEVLHHKRPLSLSMMRNLHNKLHIPAESLLGV